MAHLHVLKSFQNSQRFIHVAAESQIVDGCVLDDTLLVNDEEPAQGNAVFSEHTVRLCDVLLQVRHQGVLDLAQPTLVARGLNPSQMGELAVDADPKDLWKWDHVVALNRFGN